jgi:hypothetical protein
MSGDCEKCHEHTLDCKCILQATWNYCNLCNPEFFVVYGICTNCKRICEPPLWYEGLCDFKDYDKFRELWNGSKNFKF